MPKRVTTTSGNSDAKQAREPDCQSPLNQLCAVPAPKLQQTEIIISYNFIIWQCVKTLYPW